MPFAWLLVPCRFNFNDDVFITLTYAKCLAACKGFVFNGAPSALGTTTPLLALVLGGLGRLAQPWPVYQIAAFFTLFCWIGVIWAIQLCHRTLGLARWHALILGATLVTHAQFYLGGEVTLFQFLLLISVILFLQERYFLAGLSTGFLFLTRGEGALLMPVLGMMILVDGVKRGKGDKGKRRNSRSPSSPFPLFPLSPVLFLALGFSLVFGIWGVYAYHTFGSIFPNTLKVKMLQGRGEVVAASGLFPQMLADEMRRWELSVFWFFPKLRVIFWVLAAYGTFYAFRQRLRFFLVILCWVLIYIAVYAYLKVPGYAFWYRLPVFWAWNYAVALGLIGATRWLVEGGEAGKRRKGEKEATGAFRLFAFSPFPPLFSSPETVFPPRGAGMPAPVYLLWLSLCRYDRESIFDPARSPRRRLWPHVRMDQGPR